MDKYIKILLVKLSKKYKVNILSIMSYDKRKKRFSSFYKLNLEFKKQKFSIDLHSKRELIGEMMKWAS